MAGIKLVISLYLFFRFDEYHANISSRKFYERDDSDEYDIEGDKNHNISNTTSGINKFNHYTNNSNNNNNNRNDDNDN